MTASLRRKPGERIAIVLRGRVQSRTAARAQVLAEGPDWSLEAVDGADAAFRFRVGQAVADLPIDEVRTAVVRAMHTHYDDDFGAPLEVTRLITDGVVTYGGADGSTIYGNDRFTVHALFLEGPDGPIRISVHDHHRNPDISWRLLQRIKNEVAGPDRWAAEWFPDEDQLVDEANERHLFVLPKHEVPPSWFCHLGGRSVCGPEEATAEGAIQAPLPAWYPEAAR